MEKRCHSQDKHVSEGILLAVCIAQDSLGLNIGKYIWSTVPDIHSRQVNNFLILANGSVYVLDEKDGDEGEKPYDDIEKILSVKVYSR